MASKKRKAKKKKNCRPRTYKPVGRVSLLLQSRLNVQKKMVKALSDGHYLEVACTLAGISLATYFVWLERGEREYNRQQSDSDNGLEVVPDEKEAPYLEFMDVTRKASAQAEDSAVTAIKKAYDKNDWRAAALFLERRFAKRWRHINTHEHGGPNGGPIRTANATVDATSVMTAEQATDAYLRIMRDDD